jgi:Flp pilus assembly protein TadD
MLDQQQYYAALAHIAELKRTSGDSLDLRYLEAEADRNLNRTADALRLYNSLLNTSFDGEAHHGLGLLTFAADRVGAIQHLRLAVQRKPTDAQFRNDLGFALMQSGRYGEALPELATAVELEPGNLKARNNLVVLLIASGNAPRARQIARDSGMSDDAYAAAQKRAETFVQSMAQSGQKR